MDYTPKAKVQAGGIGGLIALLAVTIAGKLGYQVPAEMGAFLATAGGFVAGYVVPDEARQILRYALMAGLATMGVTVSGCSGIAPSLTFDDGKLVKIDGGTYALLDGLPSDQKHLQASTLGVNVRQLSVGNTSVDRSDNTIVADGDRVAPLRRVQSVQGTGIDYDVTMGDAFAEEAEDGVSTE